jgi:flagellar biosynthesis/type III secretory pathway protein FliH
MAERLDLDSKLAVTADPALASGDCRIAWDEGFLDYGYDAVCKQIVTLIRAAPGAAPAPKLEGQASHD